MRSTERANHASHAGWEHFGHAAEQFARRVARDARRFAEHVEKHAGEFARDLSRDWAGAWHAAGRAAEGSAPDVRHVFEDVRKVLADVIDRVDELISGLFGEEPDEAWTRVVSNRDTTCLGCGAAIGAGAGAHVRRTATGTEFRCLACGSDGSPA